MNIFRIFRALCLVGSINLANLAIADIITDFDAIITDASINDYAPGMKKLPAKITVSGKIKENGRKFSIEFDKMLAGYRGQRFVAYEHYLGVYYDKDALYLHTNGVVIDNIKTPHFLMLASINHHGRLQWSDSFEVKLSFRTYRYKISDRLLALIWGIWVKNSDCPELRLNAKDSSLTMIDLTSE